MSLPTVPPDYRPSADEPFMNPAQLAYFQDKLEKWKEELLESSGETLNNLKEDSLSAAEMGDRATLETGHTLELRTKDRVRKLISKINAALRRIDDESYGYCDHTDEPIDLQRLEARPIATMTVEAQEKHEKMEKLHRDD